MFKKTHKITRDYFSVTNKEASGLLVVFVGILFFLLSPLIFPLFPNKLEEFSNQQDQRMLDSLVSIIEQAYDTPSKTTGTSPTAQERLNINTVSLSQLRAIQLLETKIAERLIKFRDKLGGFHSTEQLNEVYGLKKELRDKLKAIFFVEEDFEVKKIALNTDGFKTLVAHPYLSSAECKLIFSNYRDQHKTIREIDTLVRDGIIDSKKAQKLIYYVSF